jgi:citrate synthase
MLLYWYHYSQNGKRIDVETDDDSIGGHFLHLLHGKPAPASWVRAMHTSLNLYAEHEYNASTFTCRVIAGTGSDIYSSITGGIGALRGPKHGGANEVGFEVMNRTRRRMTLKKTSWRASPTRKSSSASATRSIPLPIRATRSSRKSHASCRPKPAT